MYANKVHNPYQQILKIAALSTYEVITYIVLCLDVEISIPIGRKWVLIPACFLILQIMSYGFTQNAVSPVSPLYTTLEAYGHTDGISLSASTSTAPSIDGIIGTTEWSNAASQDFVLRDCDPERCAGVFNSIYATIYVMNDHANLYTAVRTSDTGLERRWVQLFFDDNHNGLREVGEDILLSPPSPPTPNYLDWHLTTVTETGYGYTFDKKSGQDGSVAMTTDGTSNYFEFSHPLCSLDTEQDFCLSEDDIVGFKFTYVKQPSGYDYQPYYGSSIEAPSTWGDIIIAHSSVQEVTIDIMPRNSSNIIECDTQKGKVPVGIFTDDDFNVHDIDISILALEGINAKKFKLKDLDADGDIDAVAKFKKSYICDITGNLSIDSINLRLFGQTADGRQFEGTGSARIT